MNKLKAGTTGDLENSMAEAMVTAFQTEWAKIMDEDQPPPDFTPQMKLMFIAIAQGVVKHLVDNAGAIKVNVNNTTLSGNTTTHKHSTSVSITI